MRHFRKRVGLVHELRQLRGPEEFPHRRCRRLRVDQVMRHDGVNIDRPHAFLDRAFHAQQTNAILIFHQFANRPHAAIAEVINIVNLPATILQVEQYAQCSHNILLAQDTHIIRHFFQRKAKAHIHLHAPDRGKVIAFHVEEQATEKRFRRLGRRRLTRTHHAINIHQRFVTVGILVHRKRIAHPGTNRLINRERRQTIETDFLNQVQLRLGQFLAGFGPDFPGFHIHQVFCHKAAKQFSAAHQHFRRARFGDLACQARRQLRVLFRHHFTGARIHQRFRELHATEAIRIKSARPALGAARKHHLAIEGIQDFLGIHAADFMQFHLPATLGTLHFSGRAIQRVKQRGDRQLALAVNANIANVLGIEFEIEP